MVLPQAQGLGILEPCFPHFIAGTIHPRDHVEKFVDAEIHEMAVYGNIGKRRLDH